MNYCLLAGVIKAMSNGTGNTVTTMIQISAERNKEDEFKLPLRQVRKIRKR